MIDLLSHDSMQHAIGYQRIDIHIDQCNDLQKFDSKNENVISENGEIFHHKIYQILMVT